jgi:hypothetical protein
VSRSKESQRATPLSSLVGRQHGLPLDPGMRPAGGDAARPASICECTLGELARGSSETKRVHGQPGSMPFAQRVSLSG